MSIYREIGCKGEAWQDPDEIDEVAEVESEGDNEEDDCENHEPGQATVVVVSLESLS